MVERHRTVETFIARLEKLSEKTAVVCYDEVAKIPLSRKFIFLKTGHVDQVLSRPAFNLSDFVFVRGKKNEDDTMEKYFAHLIHKLKLKERDLYLPRKTTETMRSPVILGQIPWEELLHREAFKSDRQTQFFFLDMIDQELGQSYPSTEMEYFELLTNRRAALQRIRRIVMNVQIVEAFLNSAKEHHFSFETLGESEFKALEIERIKKMTSIDELLPALEELENQMTNYLKPVARINIHINRWLGPQTDGKRLIDTFAEKIGKPIEKWTTKDFKRYLKIVPPVPKPSSPPFRSERSAI